MTLLKEKPPNGRLLFIQKITVSIFLLLFFSLSCSALTKITDKQLREVYEIGAHNDVPASIVRALMAEESGGYVDAFSDLTKEGFRSRGLFQIYERPDNLGQLLDDHWKRPREEFNINDPIDNATVALSYLSALHSSFGNWYQALIFYNHGDVKHYPQSTRAYAKRIINAP